MTQEEEEDENVESITYGKALLSPWLTKRRLKYTHDRPDYDAAVQDSCQTEWAALHFAARKGYGKLAAELIRNWGADVNAADIEGRTPLYIATM